jgi:hypothetical protein
MLKKIFLTNSTLQDFRNIREGYSKQEDQDVQGTESPYRGRSYLGKERGIEGGVSQFVF